MCGRYVLIKTNELGNRFNISKILDDIQPSYNIAPSQYMPVVVRQSPNSIKIMKWGLIPSWAKDPAIGFKLINARAETISTAPSFRASFLRRRCLVPSDGFYEWKATGDSKHPYYFRPKDNSTFAFTGLFDIWKDAEGREIYSYTIITTEPNTVVRPVHNRMPVILHKEDEDSWLDESSQPEKLLRLLKPIEPEYLECYEVGKEVGSPVNNNPKLIEKVK